MNILAIDTTSSAVSAAVANDEKLLGVYMCNDKMTHLQKLMPMIDNLIKNCEMEINDITHIAVSEGPGSFTGIRIGVSAAKALAQVNDIPVISVPALKALAYNIPFFQGLVCPVFDARRQQVYGAVYRWQNKKCNEFLAPGAYDASELLSEIEGDEKVIFLGDGADAYRDVIIKELGKKAEFAPSHLKLQNAASVAMLAYEMILEGKEKHYADVKPVYLRKAEAERKLEEKRK